MERLFQLLERPRVRWWYETVLIALVFVPTGLFLAYQFFMLSTRSELAGAELTALGYLLVASPAVASVACFGTVLLRLAGRLPARVGCLTGLFAVVAFVLPALLGSALVLAAIFVVVVAPHWQLALAVVAGFVLLVVVMSKLLDWLYPSLNEED